MGEKSVGTIGFGVRSDVVVAGKLAALIGA